MAVKEKQADSSEEIEWSVENEIQLFSAMNGLKPVGKKSDRCPHLLVDFMSTK